MKKYVRCIDPRDCTSMKHDAVYEVLEERTGTEREFCRIQLASGSSSGSLRNNRFKEWVPEVGDQVVGPGTIRRVITEIDPKMFPNGKVGVRLVVPATNASDWVAFPDRKTMANYLTPLTCTQPLYPNPKAADGREVRDLSHLDKTLGELLAEDSRRKLVAASVMATEGPKLKPSVIGPERDPAFLHDEEAMGTRNRKVKELKDLLVLSRKRGKEAHAALVKLIGKEEADAV
jgi:hypothetical protein